MKLVVCIQARTGSSRLPGKVLLPLAGKPLLSRMVERVRAATIPSEIIVITTEASEDDSVAELCLEIGVNCYRGHPTDLLDRHYRAAIATRADAVVKIPSDCPLIDPKIIDRVMGYYLQHSDDNDYVSNLHPASYPDGNDVEVMSIDALADAWREADRSFEREHTTPYIWERPQRFRIGNVRMESGQDYSMTHRWTIDYPDDYDFISKVYDALYHEDAYPFGMEEILDLLERNPELKSINEAYAGVNWYRHHLKELKTISKDQTQFEPNASKIQKITA